VRQRLDRIVEKALPVVVGHANGADKVVQAYLLQQRYSPVEVFSSHTMPRNNLGGWPSRAFRLFPTVANGRPAFAFYKSGDPCLPGESAHAAFAPHCIQVVWLAGRRVGRIVSFLSPRLVTDFGFGARPPV
jgi:hypothetical protein